MGKGARFTLADLDKLGAKAKADAMAQLQAQQEAKLQAQTAVLEAAPSQRRIRQARNEMNKLESAYYDILCCEHGKENVFAQSLRLRLANGAWYKADFWLPAERTLVEVKGPHAFRGGFEFIKVAAAQHTWAKFILVWRERGQWYKQEVLP